MSIPFLPATYFSPGRLGTKIDLIVVHWMDGTLAGTDQVFTNGSREASAHYGVEDGTVHQYVKDENTAWGAGDWPTNLRSINIEHSAQPGRNATDATYNTSAALIADICKRHGITPSATTIRPHHDFTSTSCPGTLDVGRLIGMVQARMSPTITPAASHTPHPTGYVPDLHWVVEPGDSMTHIAAQPGFGGDVNKLAKFNGINLKTQVLEVGEWIWPPVGYGTWTIDKGDTLIKIIAWCWAHWNRNITEKSVCNANGINNANVIPPIGHRLVIR